MSSQPSSPRTAAMDASTSPPSEELPSKKQALSTCLCVALPCILIVGFISLLVGSIYDAVVNTPRFYLSDFRGPPLNASRGAATILCEFTIQNTFWIHAVEYDDFFISLRNPSGQMAFAKIWGFKQVFHGEVQQEVSLQLGLDMVARAPWNASAGTAVFRVLLQTRYKPYDGSTGDNDDTWSEGWYLVRVGADVEVNAEGRMTSVERILLASPSLMLANTV